MNVDNKRWPVLTFKQYWDYGKINAQPEYQRGPVWNVFKQQLLIDSILRKYDIPKIYVASVDYEGYSWEVVDGQQRMTAVLNFIDDKFALGTDSKDLPYGDLSGKSHSELPKEALLDFGTFVFDVMEIRDHSGYEVRHLFRRLQEGVSLNAAEVRNAMYGKMRDFIWALGTNHNVFPNTNYPSTRYNWHDLAAHITKLELNDDETDLSAKDLARMYEFHLNFEVDGHEARKINQQLNYLSKVLAPKPPEMKIKWGFVDLYWLISRMSQKYVIKNREEDFLKFYIDFEKNRTLNSMAELLEKIEDGRATSWESDLYQYGLAFQREGNKRDNIRTRHEIYSKFCLLGMDDLISKDSKRKFDETERVIIWRLADESCAKCNKPIELNEMHADHINPHSEGGRTTLKNAQSLCATCNLKKSDSVPTT